ncbi:unnamed protein product [Rotaria socialis]
MLSLITLISALIYPAQSVKIVSTSTIIESETPTVILKEPTSKKQLVTTEGRFIIAEGNSNHLFEPSDFIKEHIVQNYDDNTRRTKTDENVRSSNDDTHIQSADQFLVYNKCCLFNLIKLNLYNHTTYRTQLTRKKTKDC